MKRFLISLSSLLFASAILFSGCGSDTSGSGSNNQNSDVGGDDNSLRGKITIAALDENFALANQLASAYVTQNKNVIVDVEALSLKEIKEAMDEDRYHLYFLNGLQNPYPELQNQIIASDVFVLCVNFNNPVLQKLVIRGLMPSKIREIYSSTAILKWSDIVKTDEISPVKAFLGAENSSSYRMIQSFLGVNHSQIVGTALNEQDLYSNIANNTGAIGFLSSVLAYDRNTLFRAKGLYILPVDFDENKVADDNELIYDDLNILKNAVKDGGYPKALIRNHYFVWNSSVPQKEIVDDFIGWTRENSSAYIEKNGFFEPFQDNETQN